METDDVTLLDQWIEKWADLVTFETFPSPGRPKRCNEQPERERSVLVVGDPRTTHPLMQKDPDPDR